MVDSVGADECISAALTGYGGKWTYDELNGFLKNPKKYIEGTKMSFAGLKKSNDRIPEIDILVEDNQTWKKDNFEAKISIITAIKTF